MVVLDTLEEWQRQSALLLQARPSTARITTKYNVPNLSTPRYNRPPSKNRASRDTQTPAHSEERAPRATLTLKTFDTASGVTLKFKTDRGADVGRLIAGLGTLGRHMAALPEKAEAKDISMENTDTVEAVTSGDKTPASTQQGPAQNSGGTAGKKKKKGKR